MEIQITKNSDGRYSAFVPELHAHTQGKNRDDLMTNISECVKLSVDCMRSELANKKVAEKFERIQQSPRFYLNMEHLFDASYA